MYKLIFEKEPVIRLSDGVVIGTDTPEYQEYKGWVAGGGVPQPADLPDIEPIKCKSIDKVKELRRIVFSALAGLQSEASAKGLDALRRSTDPALTQAERDAAKAEADSYCSTASGIIPVQLALRNLTDIDLSGCQTKADVDGCFLNAWSAIVQITPENVRTAFNGVI